MKRFASLVCTFFLQLILPIISFAQEAAESPSVKEVAATKIDTMRHLINLVVEFILKYSLQAMGGFIVLFIGWMGAKYLAGFINRFLAKKHIDITVAKFIVGAVKLTIMAFAVIVALGKFGIEIAPLIAGISVVGFGTSFALQGPLSNYASGATLIFTKPFKVGDIIEVAGVMGEVTDLKLPRTELKTVDDEMIVIPNKHIVGEIIQNYSQCKRLDITVGVAYNADVDKAIKIIKDILARDKKVTTQKQPKVGISQFADSSIVLTARLWCAQDHYYDVLFEVNRAIFAQFKQQGVTIPFPQRDIHVYKDT